MDELFDFFMEQKVRPFVELGFMPSDLKSSDETVFWWKGNISPPSVMEEWVQLVTSLVKHCLNRYGMEEVSQWYFEVWNEPDYQGTFWAGSREDYFELYRHTAAAITGISDQLRVGGPGLAFPMDHAWLDDFMNFCKRQQVPLDFVSYHIYYDMDDVDQLVQLESQEFMKMMSSTYHIALHGKHHTSELAHQMKDRIGRHFPSAEIHITEWNVSASSRNYIHDTAFMAPFIISNVLKTRGMAHAIAYWAFTDIFEEFKAGGSLFHGGFGLMNQQGIKKSSYWAYFFLGKLGDLVISEGDDYIITRKNGDIQILAYHYVYFDNLYRNGDMSGLTQTERYSIYEEAVSKMINITLFGLHGTYRLKRYVLNRDHGSAFDTWLQMGAPEVLTAEETTYLKQQALYQFTVEELDLTDVFNLSVHLPAHGVELIVLERSY